MENNAKRMRYLVHVFPVRQDPKKLYCNVQSFTLKNENIAKLQHFVIFNRKVEEPDKSSL